MMIDKLIHISIFVLSIFYLNSHVTVLDIYAASVSLTGNTSSEIGGLADKIFSSTTTFLSGSLLTSILTGVVSAIIFALIFNHWQKPRLSFSREAVETRMANDRYFYHVRVNNKGHTTAYNCKIDIDFIGKHLAEPISIRYGKWAENPEPVVLVSTPGHMPGSFSIKKIPDISLLRNTWYMNIPPKSSKSFSLLLKYKHETDCYAFNAQNYVDGFPADLRVEDRKMPQGSYISKITVKGDNAQASTKFLIRNNGPEFLDLFILKMKI